MPKIKKSLLFTAHYADGKLTCVRCNLTGRFVKRSVYLAVESKHTNANGVITSFNAVNIVNVSNVCLLVFCVLSVLSINFFNTCFFSVIIAFCVAVYSFFLSVIYQKAV